MKLAISITFGHIIKIIIKYTSDVLINVPVIIK